MQLLWFSPTEFDRIGLAIAWIVSGLLPKPRDMKQLRNKKAHSAKCNGYMPLR
jgi:hypothetical protein